MEGGSNLASKAELTGRQTNPVCQSKEVMQGSESKTLDANTVGLTLFNFSSSLLLPVCYSINFTFKCCWLWSFLCLSELLVL